MTAQCMYFTSSFSLACLFCLLVTEKKKIFLQGLSKDHLFTLFCRYLTEAERSPPQLPSSYAGVLMQETMYVPRLLLHPKPTLFSSALVQTDCQPAGFCNQITANPAISSCKFPSPTGRQKTEPAPPGESGFKEEFMNPGLAELRN